MSKTLAPFALAPLLLLAASACQRESPRSAAPPARVENAALGVVFTELPAGVAVARNEGESLELVAADPAGEGRIEVRIEARNAAGINLVEEAKAFGAAAEEAGGRFFGANELVTPLGPAYTARAAVDGGATEERRVLMVHPADPERLLVVALRYPPGDAESARRRLQQMLELVTALEPLAAAAAAGPVGG